MSSFIGYDIGGAPQTERVMVSDDHNTTTGNGITDTLSRLHLPQNPGKSATGNRRKKTRFVESRLTRHGRSSSDENHHSETSTSGSASPCTASRSLQARRLLMSSWLVMMANDNQIDSICWHDEKHTQIRILWKHGSKSSWTTHDSQLFMQWAEYTGKSRGSKSGEAQSKKWKANFRCAINSLSDVTEVKSLSQKGGSHPYKVYQINREPKEMKINSTKTVKKHEKSIKCHLSEVHETTHALEGTASTSQKPPSPRTNTSNGRQRSHYRVSNDVIKRKSVPDEIIPLPVVEYSTSYPMIPTVVEEMTWDNEWLDEDSRSDQFDDDTLRSYTSTSPESSGYSTDNYCRENVYFDQDACFDPHVIDVTYIADELKMEETIAYQNLLRTDLSLDDGFDLLNSLHVN